MCARERGKVSEPCAAQERCVYNYNVLLVRFHARPHVEEPFLVNVLPYLFFSRECQYADFGEVKTKRIYQVGPSDGEGSPGPDQTELRNDEGFKEIEEKVTFLFTKIKIRTLKLAHSAELQNTRSSANEVQTN